MRVVFEEIDPDGIRRMSVADPGEADRAVGECAGYYCTKCEQADETLHQIWHDNNCSHAGEHGRAHYDELEPDVPRRPTPEFDPAHPISVIEAGESDVPAGIHVGMVVGFRCECGNADEDVFEIVHDERCPLADCADPVGGQLESEIATDGGR